jgi:hypothetical protein
MSGQGTVTINFGAWPGSQEASVAFTDATVLSTSSVEVWVMASATTADHTANDHKYLPLLAQFTAEPNAGVGGIVHGRSLTKLIGTFKLNYVWA